MFIWILFKIIKEFVQVTDCCFKITVHPTCRLIQNLILVYLPAPRRCSPGSRCDAAPERGAAGPESREGETSVGSRLVGRESAARPPPGDPARGGGSPEPAPDRPARAPRFPGSPAPCAVPAAPGAPPPPRLPPQPQLARPGPRCRMGLPLRGPVAARTDTAPLVWGQDDS